MLNFKNFNYLSVRYNLYIVRFLNFISEHYCFYGLLVILCYVILLIPRYNLFLFKRFNINIIKQRRTLSSRKYNNFNMVYMLKSY